MNTFKIASLVALLLIATVMAKKAKCKKGDAGKSCTTIDQTAGICVRAGNCQNDRCTVFCEEIPTTAAPTTAAPTTAAPTTAAPTFAEPMSCNDTTIIDLYGDDDLVTNCGADDCDSGSDATISCGGGRELMAVFSCVDGNFVFKSLFCADPY